MATGLLLDPLFEKHDTGPGHPESSARMRTIIEKFQAEGLPERATPLEFRAAVDGELRLVHSEEYVATAREDITSGEGYLSTGDTIVCDETLEVALAAVGGVLNAVDAVFAGKVENAFCAVRPPGHHATPVKGMGFCVFNNIAIAARYAQQKYGVERVAIADWDVHHGNGTQDAFVEDPSVFFFSTHQYPWYPGSGSRYETGKGKGEGSTLNAPLPAGAGMEDIRDAFQQGFLKAMKDFKPDLVLLSAGFDSRLGDPLGDFRLEDKDFRELTKFMMGLAESTAENRFVSVLEGGYNLEGLAAASAAHLDTLISG